jgi:hypothetical protein
MMNRKGGGRKWKVSILTKYLLEDAEDNHEKPQSE